MGLLVAILVLLLVVVIGTKSGGNNAGVRSPNQDKSLSSVESCGDPIMTLKSSSVLEGLTHGAVAADHPVCSNVGLKILRDEGGNAVDAAVAVALCLGVANPASSGLGGGAFILIHADEPTHSAVELPPFVDATTNSHSTKSGKITEVIDCREVAPAAATRDMYKGKSELASEQGGLAIGVPGELRGLELAHARHGRLSWAAVVEPAMELAEKGVPVNPNLANEIKIMATIFSSASNKNIDFGLRSFLTKQDSWDSPLVEGDLLKNPTFANTLRAIRDGGSDALYKGDRAMQLAQDIQNAGGIVTQQDIENYRATLRSPVVAHDIHGFSIVGVPPPSSGGAAIVGAARFLAGYKSPLASFADTLSVHRMVEACKHAFSIRMSLSDPAFNSDTVTAAVNDLVTGPYIEELRKITRDNETLPLSLYGGTRWSQLSEADITTSTTDAKEGDRRRLARRFGYLNDGGTSHFSIVDQDGNAVSMTTSVNTYFGSKVMSKSQGIVLSNTMDDFANPGRPDHFGLHPSEANEIVPGKKPLSSMSPTMVFRRSAEAGKLGQLILVLGASGGPKIISAVVQIFANMVLLGLSLWDSIIHARFHDQLIYHGAALVTVENMILDQGPSINVTQRTRNALISRGHTLLDVDYEGTVQAIAIDLETNELTAACDVRKGGSPAGY
jgi:gamma-glutamyltranspeptidase